MKIRKSTKKIAESIGIQRQNINKSVFEKHSIDTDLLCTISDVLEYNFFDHFSNIDSNGDNGNQKDYEEMVVTATISLEMGLDKKDKVIRFSVGDNGIEILNEK